MKGRKLLPHSALRNFFGDRLIYEAKAGLAVVPIDIDIKKAAPKNPTECVFAQACKRAYDTDIAVFFRRVAYIELLDPKSGEKRVTRFRISKLAQHAIEAFDNGRDAKPGAFILTAPSHSDTIEWAAKYRHEHPKGEPKPGRKKRRAAKPFRGRVMALAAMGLVS